MHTYQERFFHKENKSQYREDIKYQYQHIDYMDELKPPKMSLKIKRI